MASISRPTLPVAPTTATLKPILILQLNVKLTSGRQLVYRAAKRRELPSLLVGNARQFNGGNRKPAQGCPRRGRLPRPLGQDVPSSGCHRRPTTPPNSCICALSSDSACVYVGSSTLFMDTTGGSMRADKLLTVMAAVAATAAATLVTAPTADAQAPTVRRHAPARVTVHPRSYLHPGTETKTYAEHSSDYFRSPAHGFAPRRSSTLFLNGASLPLIHDRMPFPSCLD